MERVFTELHDAYSNSASGQKGCMVCLASIKNARDIIDSNISLRQLLEYSEVPQSFASYVSVGLNLSKYVDVKEDFK